MAEETSRLKAKGAERIEKALGKAMPDAAFDFGLILAIITALAPVLTNCFNSRRIRKSIKGGDDTFVVANFRAAHSKGLSVGESVAFALEMKAECAGASDDEIDEFVTLCAETTV